MRREQRVKTLEQQLGELTSPVPDEVDNKQLEKMFGELINDNVPRARQALRKLLEGPIWVKPEDGKGYAFRGETKLGALLPPDYVTLASPRGFEPLLPA